MADIAAERPHFFEGQYLGAADLTALLSYVRAQDARHTLALHAWGIATGLNLLETSAPDGSIEVFLQPGYAFDGYGRPVVVLSPYQIPAELFAGAPNTLIEVWLRYAEREQQGVRRGFEVCDAVDAFARVGESFVVEVGARPNVADRQSGVVLAGQQHEDVRDAWRVFDENAPLICDGSVPHQEFPQDDRRARWLIPVGYVSWQGGMPGAFQSLTDEQRRLARIFRRQVGLVSETIQATNGLIRLRDRGTHAVAGQSNDSVCATDQITPTDLLICNGTLQVDDLVWIEGNLRITGNAKLFDTNLEFRDEHGSAYLNPDGTANSTPLLMRRASTNSLGGDDLQILLGLSADGRNRVMIGQTTVAGDPCNISFNVTEQVAIQDDGKVGLGTFNPTSVLAMPLTIRGIGNNGELLGFERENGDRLWQINQGPDKNGLSIVETSADISRWFLAPGGNVGIGTLAPGAKLDIASVRATSGGSSLGSDVWLRVGNGADSGRVWFEYGDQAAPLVVLSDQDDPPRIQFQQIGSGAETAPEFLSWFGHAHNSSADLAIIGANLGIGTTSPSAQLDVRGNIKLGAAGQLFGLGGVDNLRVIVGRIAGTGAIAFGSGYSASRTLEGQYAVTFTTPYPSAPVVVLSPVNASDNDHIVTVRNLSGGGFQVLAKDATPLDEGNLRDTEFTFVALGQSS